MRYSYLILYLLNMEKSITPKQFIASVRESFEGSVTVYTRGSCYRFYKILKLVFPDAEPWVDVVEGHVITKIGDRFYDITGEVIKNQNCLPFSQEPNLEKRYGKFIYKVKI